MGLFTGVGNFVDDLTGKSGARAANNAANVQVNGYQQQQDYWRPVSQFGMDQIAPLSSDATAGGYSSSIGDILRGQGFTDLVDARQRASNAALSSSGLRRSGAAATEAARIPADLAMSIEQELNRRRMSNFNAGSMGMQGVSNAMGSAGEAAAGGILGAQQARSQGAQNIFGGLTSIGGALLQPGGLLSIGGGAAGGAMGAAGAAGGGIGSILGGAGSMLPGIGLGLGAMALVDKLGLGGNGLSSVMDRLRNRTANGNMPQDYNVNAMRNWVS
jgi:hypothetical protein